MLNHSLHSWWIWQAVSKASADINFDRATRLYHDELNRVQGKK